MDQDTSNDMKNRVMKMTKEISKGSYPSLPWNIEMLESLNFLHTKKSRMTSKRYYEIFLFRKYEDEAFLVNSRRPHMVDEFISKYASTPVYLLEDTRTGQFFAMHPANPGVRKVYT